jgi:hypothetical protein
LGTNSVSQLPGAPFVFGKIDVRSTTEVASIDGGIELTGAPSDSAAEREFREIMERDYLKAVDATLGAIRKMVADPQYAA